MAEQAEFGPFLREYLLKGYRGESEPAVWSSSEFAEKIAVSELFVLNWMTGTSLPDQDQFESIVHALFGRAAVTVSIATNQLVRSHPGISYASTSHRKEMIQIAENFARRYLHAVLSSKWMTDDYEKLQSFMAVTPLVGGAKFISLSVFLGPQHNRFEPLEEHAIQLEGFRVVPVSGFRELLESLVDWPDFIEPLREEIIADILYNGSIQSAKTSQLEKLPRVLKAFAELSGEQFRVGLFRLSTTIVVIAVFSSAGTYAGWKGLQALHSFAESLIPMLQAKEVKRGPER
jgi:hypothetical protein